MHNVLWETAITPVAQPLPLYTWMKQKGEGLRTFDLSSSSAFISTRGQTTTGEKMASFSGRVLRLARQRAVLMLFRRRLSYPWEPLNQPIPGLSAPTASSSLRPDQVDKASLAKVRVTELENGLRVASQEAFGQYSTIGVLVDAGSRYEVDYTSGVSHFIQRLAFQGTSQFESREAIMSELESYGGIFDCQRFRDLMMYSLSVFSYGLPRAMEILSDCIWRPQLTEQELDMERQAISFELEDMNNSPNAEPLLVELIHQSAYRDNTLGLPCICPEDNISKIGVGEMKQYLASLYKPSRMVLTGVNVNHDSFVELARKHFVGTPTSWEGVEPKPIDQSVAQYTSFDVKVHREGPPVVGPNPLPELIHIGIAMESSSYLDDDFFAFAVLNSLMGGGGSFSAGGPGKGMYTHLYRDVLSRHHWVYWAMAQNHAYADSGIFCLFGSCHPSKAHKLVDVLCHQFHCMTEEPNEVALGRAKKMLTSAMMMNLESKMIVFEDIGRQIIGQGKKFSAEELARKIDAVTAADLVRVGRRLLDSNPAFAAIGDLHDLPSRRTLERTLFSNHGNKARRLFSFR